MASGFASRLLLIVLTFLTCALLAAAALNFAESNDMVEDLPTCKVTVRTENIIEGKCVRLRGGRSACQTDAYLDPLNDDCNDLN